MSGKSFVRASKYRHVHGEPTRKDKCYLGINSLTDGDGNNIKVNRKYFAFPAVGGGGKVNVINLEKIGRQDLNLPSINVHKSKVLELDFSPFVDNLIATGSDDLAIKLTVFPAEGLTSDITEAAVNFDSAHAKKVTWLHWHPTANNILGSASADATVKIWDVQSEKPVCSLQWNLEEAVHSFEWNQNGSLIGATTRDKQVKIVDPRNFSAVQSTAGLTGGKASRFVWMENHNLIAIVGSSLQSVRQYALYDPRKLGTQISVNDIDNSAGVLIPHYDPDNSILYLAGKGDANIKYFEITDEDPHVHFLSDFRHNEAQKSVAFAPKAACDSSVCEIAFCLRLMKDYVMPVSFQVPRKSDMFQEDLYPDTISPTPVLTSTEWLNGQNKDPVKVPFRSLKDQAASSKAAANFVPAKSAAQLQKELDAANARIAELEKQLAALKH